MSPDIIQEKLVPICPGARITGTLGSAVYIRWETGEVEPREMRELVRTLEHELKAVGLVIDPMCTGPADISGWIKEHTSPEIPTLQRLLIESTEVTRITSSPGYIFVSLEMGNSTIIWLAEHIEQDYMHVYGLTPEKESLQIRIITQRLPANIHTRVRRLVPYHNAIEKELLIKELQKFPAKQMLLDLVQYDPFNL